MRNTNVTGCLKKNQESRTTGALGASELSALVRDVGLMFR